jgi:hypothetical protein
VIITEFAAGDKCPGGRDERHRRYVEPNAMG